MGDMNLRDAADVAKVKKILADLGLKSPAMHGLHGADQEPNLPDESRRKEMIDEHLRFMEHTAELGCRTYVMHPGRAGQDVDREESWSRVRACLDVLAPRAESLGVTLALENANPGHLGDNAQNLHDFVQSYNSPAVRLCFDSGHAHRAEEAPTVLQTMSPLVVTVHLHDNDKSRDQHRLPGNGTIDWPPVIELLDQCPSLMHVETEPFNDEHWEYKAIYELFQKLVNG
jgi:sugar phosphate isomerase/epimerase